MEELTEEILLRLPPDNSASLVRAALVCKIWRCLISGAAFRRRFLEFHRRGIPLLCVLYNYSWNEVRMLQMPMAYFVPATSFRPTRAAAGAGHGQCKFVWRAIDARHDRVLFCRSNPSIDGQDVLSVWDPFTDEHHELPGAPSFLTQYLFHKQGLWNAAVACAAAAVSGTGGSCDHLDCHRGPFMVVFMHIQPHNMYLSVYSSEATAWSNLTVSERPTPYYFSTFNFKVAPGVLVQSAFYFLVHFNDEIVGYNMARHKVSTVRLPDRFRCLKRSIIVLMNDDDGGLGFVANVKNKLELWSRMDGADGDADFVLTRVIDLQKVLPSGALIKKSTQVNGFADGGAHRVLFIRIFDGLYTIEINSGQVRKLDNCCGNKDVVPYISFCTPTSKH